MRLIVIFLFVIGFFVELPVVTTAQSNGTIPPATALVITGEQVGGAETRDVAYADLDQDNDVDVFVVEWDHSEIWFNQGNGQYLKGEQKLGDSVQNAVALGDLDEDGDIDAFIAKQDAVLGKPNEVWLNNGKGVFSDSGQRLSADDYSANIGVQLADLDQDQDLDAFVVANLLSYSSSKNDVVPWGDAVTLTDVDEDGDLDVIVVSRFVHYGQWAMVENAVVVHFNNGSGRLTQSMITYIPPTAPTSIDRSRIAFLALSERLYLPFLPNAQ